MQAHPASAAAAAVLVAHASSLGPNGNANTKYNADGSSITEGLNDLEQGMGQGPLGQGRDVINAAPLVRQQTFGPVQCCCSLYPCLASFFFAYGHGKSRSRACCRYHVGVLVIIKMYSNAS